MCICVYTILNFNCLQQFHKHVKYHWTQSKYLHHSGSQKPHVSWTSLLWCKISVCPRSSWVFYSYTKPVKWLLCWEPVLGLGLWGWTADLPFFVLRHCEEDYLEINTKPWVLSLRSAGAYEISHRWRAGMHGLIFEVKTKLLQGYSSFLLLFLQVPQGTSPSASSRGTFSPLKIPPSKETSSATIASSLSPIRPPGAAVDGNCAASSLLFPAVQLIHFKLLFFF